MSNVPQDQRLKVPAGIADESTEALATLLEERLGSIPVERCLVWHITSVVESALPQLARDLGIDRITWLEGPPRALLLEGVAVMKTRGVVAHIEKALDVLGYEDMYELHESEQLYLDGTWWLDGSRLLDGGAWYVCRIILQQEAPLTSSAARELIEILEFLKPKSRRIELVVALPGGERHTYRDGSLEPTITFTPDGTFDGTFDDTFN
ncbi:MAG TPA: phage tail protein [Polyangiaceae bacterium]|nr:phage tail protein [Polyangiaceae bacterium]